MTAPQLYLASRSPRRRELLALAGIAFTLLDIEIDEAPHPAEDPRTYVDRIAAGKAAAGWSAARARRAAALPVLSADTTVVLEGRILGKPDSPAQAAQMLMALSGRAHWVYTAVAVREGDRVEALRTESMVRFALLSRAQVDQYVAGGEPMDKAGAYAIQGGARLFVERIEGSLTGIVGLPLPETLALLRRFGVG